MAELPTHRNEQTGNPQLDRIQGVMRDVIAYARSLVWLTRRAYTALATDITLATSASYATLLSTTLATDLRDSFIVAHFTASGVHLTAQGTTLFRVVVDGAAQKGAWTTVGAGFAFTAAVLVRVAVSKGMHTIKVEWRTDANSARINASTVTEEHASLHVHEEAA